MSKELLGLYRNEVYELTIDREGPPITRDLYRFNNIRKESLWKH